MKIKEGFLLRKVAGSNVIVPVGEETMEFNGMLTTNDTGAFIFEKLQAGIVKEDIVKEIIKEFDIEEEIAAKDVEAFINKLKEADLFE